MDLNEFASFKKLDPQNMLGEIDNLPRQLQSAWELGQQPPLPDVSGLNRILISGMGGSAIGADLLSAYIAPTCKLPVIVHRDYTLPAWAYGPETLVIASSHSGNTEETLAAFDAAVQAGCRLLAVCTGGELEQRAKAHKVPVWKFTTILYVPLVAGAGVLEPGTALSASNVPPVALAPPYLCPQSPFNGKNK